MPETLEKPVADELFEFSASDTPIEGEPDEPAPQEEPAPKEEAAPAPAAPAPAPEAKTEEVKPAILPVELVHIALNLGISPGEIEGMGEAELRRTVSHLDRVLRTKKEEKVEPVVDEEPLDESLYDPVVVKTIKETRKLAAEQKKLAEENAALKAEIQNQRVEAINQRLDAHIAAVSKEASSQFDRRTPQGAKNFEEFSIMMGSLYQGGKAAGKNYTEPQLVKMAISALGGVIPATQPTAEETKKKEWDNGALGAPAARSGAESAEERVRRLLREIRKEEKSKPREETDWL